MTEVRKLIIIMIIGGGEIWIYSSDCDYRCLFLFYKVRSDICEIPVCYVFIRNS